VKKFIFFLMANFFILTPNFSYGECMFNCTRDAEVRPLINQAVRTCQKSYLDAIKPTPVEITFSLERSLTSVTQSHENALNIFSEIESRDKFFKENPVDRMWGKNLINQYIGVTRPKKVEELTKELSIRNTCWEFFKSIKGTQTDYNLLISHLGGYALSPFLLNELSSRGGSLYYQFNEKGLVMLNPIDKKRAILPTNTSTVFYLTMLNLLKESKINENTSRSKFATYLISILKNQKLINERGYRGTEYTSRGMSLSYQDYTLLTHAIKTGDDFIINLLLDSGADPKLTSTEGNHDGSSRKIITPIDIYLGNDPAIVKKLSGIALPFNPPKSVDLDPLNSNLDALSVGNLKSGISNGNINEFSSSIQTPNNTPDLNPNPNPNLNPKSQTISLPSSLISSYSGILKSTLAPNRIIEVRGEIFENGEFKFESAVGVQISGIIKSSANGIEGNGLTKLPKNPDGSPMTYRNGTTESKIGINGEFNGRILTGRFSSDFEIGNFVVCVPSAKDDPQCRPVQPDPIGNILKGLGGFLMNR